MNNQKRFYDLDWLRVLGMLGIFLFHNARFFNEEDWHVKNLTLDFGMEVFVQVLNHFIMPLFFVLSAAAIYYSIKKRTNHAFMRERAARLLIPFAVGVFTHVMLQVYIENVTHGRFSGSFWEFIPNYFNGFYAFGGNFAWMGLHLWYLPMLFLFSWLMLSSFRRLQASPTFTTRLADTLATPLGVYLFILPVFLVELLVSLSTETIGRRDFGGWSPLTYLVFFIIGYVVVTDPRYRAAIQKVRFVSLVLALATVFAAYTLLAEMGVSGINPVYLAVRASNAWAWLLTFMGFASRHLDFDNRFLQYANQAVLPFYIMHQSVIVIVGYFARGWDMAVLPKYGIMVVASFLIIMLVYEFVVRRVRFLRLLFGMKSA